VIKPQCHNLRKVIKGRIKNTCHRASSFGKLQCVTREIIFWCDTSRKRKTSINSICRNETYFPCDMLYPWKFSNITMHCKGKISQVGDIMRDKNFREIRQVKIYKKILSLFVSQGKQIFMQCIVPKRPNPSEV
jgi:hypothetical protein